MTSIHDPQVISFFRVFGVSWAFLLTAIFNCTPQNPAIVFPDALCQTPLSPGFAHSGRL